MPNVNYSNALTSIRQATQEAETTEEFRYSDSLLDMSTILATVAVHLGRAVSETPQTTALSRSSALASSVITQHTTYGIAKFKSDIRVYPAYLRDSWIVLSPSLRHITGRQRNSSVSISALFIKRVGSNYEISIGDVKIRDIQKVTNAEELSQFEKEILIDSIQQESVVS